MRESYEDIINAIAFEPDARHPRMSIQERAAQFAPFAALTGFDDVIDEEGLVMVDKIELDSEEKGRINAVLTALQNKTMSPNITVTYFEPCRGEKGVYRSFAGRVKKVNVIDQELIFADNTTIDFDMIHNCTALDVTSEDEM